jgi:hypothetical protein
MKTEMHCRCDFEQLYSDIREFAKRWMDDIASLMRAIGYEKQNSLPGHVAAKAEPSAAPDPARR